MTMTVDTYGVRCETTKARHKDLLPRVTMFRREYHPSFAADYVLWELLVDGASSIIQGRFRTRREALASQERVIALRDRVSARNAE